MVRRLEEKDLEKIEPLLKRCYDEMQFHKQGFGFDYSHIRRGIESNDVVAMVYEKDGAIHGVFLCVIFTEHMGGYQIAAEAVWHADPLLPKVTRARIMIELLKGIKKELRMQKIETIHISTSIKHISTHKLLERQGFEAIDKTYAGRT